MNYEAWEAERQALWNKYRPHYEQANAGTEGANPFVFEHCVLERRLCNKMGRIEGITDTQREQIIDIDSHATTIIDELYMEAAVEINAELADITCRRCGRLRRGRRIYVKLPTEGNILHDEVCSTCA